MCAVGVAWLLMGCSEPEPTCANFFGDPAQPIEMAIGHRAQGGSFVSLTEGDPIDLVRPIQGGHVLFIAARARNLCLDDVRLDAKVFDGDAFRARDFRDVRLVAQEDGWAEPDMAMNASSVANVPLCPNGASASVVNRAHRLEVKVLDPLEAREAMSEITIVPVCRQADTACRELCECECGPDGAKLGACPPPKSVTCEMDLGS